MTKKLLLNFFLSIDHKLTAIKATVPEKITEPKRTAKSVSYCAGVYLGCETQEKAQSPYSANVRLTYSTKGLSGLSGITKPVGQTISLIKLFEAMESISNSYFKTPVKAITGVKQQMFLKIT